MDAINDQKLLQLLRSADAAAFRMIYKEHFGMVRYFVINNSGREEDARDIFQEAMVVLYEKAQAADFELTASFKTWLYAVCRNLWLKQLSKIRKRVRLVDFENAEEVATEDQQEKEVVHDQLRASLGRLGVGCRKLLLLFYYFRKNMEEIAHELGYTNADNAKSQKYKCIQKLKAIHLEMNSK